MQYNIIAQTHLIVNSNSGIFPLFFEKILSCFLQIREDPKISGNFHLHLLSTGALCGILMKKRHIRKKQKGILP